MKSLAELQAIKDKMKDKVILREGVNDVRVVVGMATCGIAAGAREVMSAILQELNKRHLFDVQVQQTGCIGMCEKEVLVDVVRPGEARITYGKVTPEDVPKLIAEHVVNGHIVEELVVGRLDQE